MDSRVRASSALQRAGRRFRVAGVFAVLAVIVVGISLLGIYGDAPATLVVAVILGTTLLAWLVVRREWRAVHRLARLAGRWNDEPPETTPLWLHSLAVRGDPEIAALARGMHGLATRVTEYARREHDFTRDVSHELRSPLTVIKMSVNRLFEEPGLSEGDAHAVRRIRRASLELEAMVEALLVLAREADAQAADECFVVNDVLQTELALARELLVGRPIELLYEESARFALAGSARGFSVLCWQLIRNACQQTAEGQVLVQLTPGLLSVCNRIAPVTTDATRAHHASAASRHGFELAIARRISDRLVWPLELRVDENQQNIARIRFPEPLPPEMAAKGSAREA